MTKVRVVLDTNVYISRLLWTGLPHTLLQVAENGNLVLIATPAIVEEVREVLARAKFAARLTTLNTSVGELTESLLSLVEIIQEPKVAPVVLQDPDDDKFVACVIASRVRWLISGDEHLLSLGRYKTLRIVTPQQFWTKWGKRLKVERTS